MNFFDKIISDLRRRDVILEVYVIHHRDSEFEWKPLLDDLCEDYYVKVKLNKMDIIYEAMRLDMHVTDSALSGDGAMESLMSKMECIEDIKQEGVQLANKAFIIKILVNPEELKMKNIDMNSIEKLKEDVVAILEDSNPRYLSLE